MLSALSVALRDGGKLHVLRFMDGEGEDRTDLISNVAAGRLCFLKLVLYALSVLMLALGKKPHRSFAMPFDTKRDDFTKTGSGQT